MLTSEVMCQIVCVETNIIGDNARINVLITFSTVIRKELL